MTKLVFKHPKNNTYYHQIPVYQLTNKQVRFIIHGRWGQAGDQLTIYNHQYQPVLTLKQPKPPYPYHFFIYQNQELIAELKKHVPLPVPIYFLKQLNWIILEVKEHHYIVRNVTKQLMTITQKQHQNNTEYKLSIFNQHHEAIGIAIALILTHFSTASAQDQSAYPREILPDIALSSYQITPKKKNEP